MPAQSTAIVIGAGGGLGSALCRQWQQDDDIETVIAVSRHAESNTLQGVQAITCDYSEAAIARASEKIKSLGGKISRVCICNGLLHNDHIWPEKRIEDISLANLQEVFHVNSFIPILWLQALLPLVKGDTACIITTISARVGSIGDNQLGGWYSYRSSKAALNMFLKSAAIEYARRAPGVKLVAFHPGTTDTELSKPFQANVPAGKLFTTEFVAERLLALLDDLEPDGELSYLDWAGLDIPW